ncbi:hypothetical protein GCM10009664_37080 [Kitasatospora gansuensis]
MAFMEIAGSDEGPGWTALVLLFVIYVAVPVIVLSAAIAAVVRTVTSARRRRNPPPREIQVLRLDLESGTWREHQEMR